MFRVPIHKINEKTVLVFIVLIAFHLFIASSLFLISNSEFLSSQHYGNGFWKFAADSILYHNEVIDSLAFLEKSQWGLWWNAYSSHAHVKYISLIYWLTGYENLLIIELINAPVWSISIILVFRSAQIMFHNYPSIPFIASLFFLQPSVLIHSTQLLRDPFVLLGVCFICYGWILLHKTNFHLKAILYIVIGSLFFISMKPYLSQILMICFFGYLFYALFSKDISIKNVLLLFFSILVITITNLSVAKGDIFYFFNKSSKIDLQTNQKNLITVKDFRNTIKALNGKSIGKTHQNLIDQRVNFDLDLLTELFYSPLEINKIDNSISEQNKLEVKSFLTLMKEINNKYLNPIDESIRPVQINEAVILNFHLSYIKKFNESFHYAISNKLTFKNRDVLELSKLIPQNYQLILSRLDFLTENEQKWQSKNGISKFLDLSFWRLLEFRTGSFYDIDSKNSKIDFNISFNGFNDGIIYLPRAVQIAFLSPFPRDWLKKGYTTGRLGRIIAGFETLALYTVLSGFIFVMFTNFKVLKPLIPILILSSIIMVLASYAMPNLGTIYRFRMDLIMPFVIIGIYGLNLIIRRLKK
ncbi:MAG: hypothetical protein HOB81_03525 [Flavobacteriaceae bacterium]|jgi:hypothetical protein|nr:hypothetical protein [Flavobacteriaceae bacterium]